MINFIFLQVPIDWARDKHFDVKSFPCCHPTGKYGLHEEREVRLTSQMYFNQRLLNRDLRFATSIPYLFMAFLYVEREMLEKQISFSALKGTLTANNEVKNPQDAFSVFAKLKGSQKYWQIKRHELTSKIRQLGPFHVFVTLSCAEMRWAEVFISVLKASGVEKLEVRHGDGTNWDGDNQNIFINNVPIWEYLGDKANKNEKLMNHVLLVTRIFDNRVKSFFKNIVMKSGKDEPKFKYYSYRVEFQARGMPHIHGVLWFDPDWLKEYGLDPDLTEFLEDNNDDGDDDKNKKKQTKEEEEKEKMEREKKEEEKKKKEEKLIKLIDTLISCNIPDEFSPDGDENKWNERRREYVLASQQHDHSHTCYKKGPNCRFHFPKLPSEQTVIAKPLTGIDEKKKEKKLQEYGDILEVARHVLDLYEKDDDFRYEDITFKEFYGHLAIIMNMDVEDVKVKYNEAMSTTKNGFVIVLKRTVRERWTNNYHPLWSLAWNSNMDIQIGKFHDKTFRVL